MDSYGKKAGKGALIQEELSGTFRTNGGGDCIPKCVIAFEPGIAEREGGHIYKDKCGTIRAKPGDNQMSVAYPIENHPNDSRVKLTDDDIVQSLTSRMGTGGGAMYR